MLSFYKLQAQMYFFNTRPREGNQWFRRNRLFAEAIHYPDTGQKQWCLQATSKGCCRWISSLSQSQMALVGCPRSCIFLHGDSRKNNTGQRNHQKRCRWAENVVEGHRLPTHPFSHNTSKPTLAKKQSCTATTDQRHLKVTTSVEKQRQNNTWGDTRLSEHLPSIIANEILNTLEIAGPVHLLCII